MDQQATKKAEIYKIAGGAMQEAADVLAIEEPLEISILEDGSLAKTISITMRTPGQDEKLAAGFLFTEGIINSKEEIASLQHIAFDPNRILVTLAKGVVPKLHQADRNFYTTSSCGVCGKTSIDAIKTVSQYVSATDALRIDHKILLALPAKLREQQAVFNSTGGLHASATFTIEGVFLSMQEDVGRHNALDKLIGEALMRNELPLEKNILLLSGRASFELIQKATMAGIKIVAAVGAPSSLAVELAQDCGITLIGFLRDARFNIYTHPQRVML